MYTKHFFRKNTKEIPNFLIWGGGVKTLNFSVFIAFLLAISFSFSFVFFSHFFQFFGMSDLLKRKFYPSLSKKFKKILRLALKYPKNTKITNYTKLVTLSLYLLLLPFFPTLFYLCFSPLDPPMRFSSRSFQKLRQKQLRKPTNNIRSATNNALLSH